jgi:hypothetical protein
MSFHDRHLGWMRALSASLTRGFLDGATNARAQRDGAQQAAVRSVHAVAAEPQAWAKQRDAFLLVRRDREEPRVHCHWSPDEQADDRLPAPT